MIHIYEDWYLDADPMNITLRQKRIAKDGKHKGEEFYDEKGNYPTLQALLSALVKREIRLSASQAADIKEIVDRTYKINAMLGDFCRRLENEIRDRLKDEQETIKVPVYQMVLENENGAMCRKIGDETIPLRWKIKGIMFPIRKGDKQDGKAGEEDQRDSE